MNRLFVAVDLGEELGRVTLGTLSKGQLSVSEVHRFHNVPIRENGEVLWDVAQLYQDTLSGLLTVGLYDEPVEGISCTSWGGDYLLFHADASFIPPTRHYAAPHTEKGRKEAFSRIGWETIFEQTGRQDSRQSTLYQLAAGKPRLLKRADHLMPIADGFNFLLSGTPCVEASSACATQLFNPQTGYWSETLRAALDLSESLLPTVIPTGTRLKPLRPELVLATRLEDAHVIASCSNELAAALTVASIYEPEQLAFLRLSGKATLGTRLADPIITPASCNAGLSHTMGYDNVVFNHMETHGLQILEDCRLVWAESDHAMDEDALMHLAATAAPLESLVNLADPRFTTSDDLIPKIQSFCKETGQTVPRKPGTIFRCLLESLAFLYRRKLDELGELTNQDFARLHLLGDASQTILNHFIANAAQMPVVVAPKNTVAIGNIVVQALALGHIPDLEQAQHTLEGAFKRVTVLPNPSRTWVPAYERFLKYCGNTAQPLPA